MLIESLEDGRKYLKKLEKLNFILGRARVKYNITKVDMWFNNGLQFEDWGG
jgi:hypothetical protein